KLARECFARVSQRVLHQFPALASLRRAHIDFVSGLGRQGFGEQGPLLEFMRDENESGRRLVVIELRKKGTEDFCGADAAVGFRKVAAVAPVLRGAEKEHLDAGASPCLVD